MYVPKNKQVKTREHLKTVIISAILRQNGMFAKEDIYREVEENIKFSPFGKYGKERKKTDVKQMIDGTIMALLRAHYIKVNHLQAKYCVM